MHHSNLLARFVLALVALPGSAWCQTSIAGRLLDPAGDPIPGFPLELRRLDESGLTRGRYAGAATTNVEGRFRFDHLDAGGYAFLEGRFFMVPFDALHSPPESPPRLALGTARAGNEDVDLRIARYRIEVTAIDAEGQPLDARMALDQGEEYPPALTAGDGPRLMCASTNDALPFNARPWRSELSVGKVAIFFVEPGEEYVLTWADPAFPLQGRHVYMPAEKFRSPVRFELPATTGKTYLQLDLEDPEGQPLLGTQIHVHSQATGAPVASSMRPSSWHGDSSNWSSQFSTALPPGKYRVAVTTELDRGYWYKLPPVPPLYAPAELLVEVEAGRTTKRDVRLKPRD